MGGLTGEVKELFDALGDGGHDGVVEQGVQTSQQQSADDDGDQDLDAGIDVALSLDVGNGNHSTGGHGVALGTDGIKQLLHS